MTARILKIISVLSTALLCLPVAADEKQVLTNNGAALFSAVQTSRLDQPLAELGRQIFFDATLSDPPGTACAACHDPARGIFILGIMVLFSGGALALFAWRAPLLRQGGLFAPISREGSLVLNNLLLTTACAARRKSCCR